MSGARSRYPLSKRRTINKGGLIPRYVGYTPRAFARGEWKYVDTTGTQVMDTTGAVSLLNGLAPGNSASQRIGQKISVTSMEFKIKCEATPGTGIDQLHRFYIVLDRQANGVAITKGDVLSNGGTYIAPRNLNNRKRFRIILDKSICLSASGEANSQKFFKYYMKFRKPVLVEYNAGVAGTIADIASGSMYLGTLGNVTPGATAGSAAYYVRLRYTDM